MKTLLSVADASRHGLGAWLLSPPPSVILSEPTRAEGPSHSAIKATPTRSRHSLADAMESVPRVMEADLAEAGYHPRKTDQHTNATPDAPQNVRLQATGITSQSRIRPEAMPHTALYEVGWTFDPDNSPWMLVPAFNSTRGMTLEGLTGRKDYSVRVRAVATGQNRSPWSDIANAMAV